MKKLLYLLLLTPIIYLVSCSSGKGDLTPQIGPIEETIVGKTWKLLNSNSGYIHLNADYTYLTKDVLCDSLNEEGTWEIDENILSFSYIEGPIEYVVRKTIIELNDSIVKVQIDTSSNLDINYIFETTEDVIRGCMDSIATNFNADAVCHLECNFEGCMDNTAVNYNPNANIEDGSCCYVAGCMDEAANNYDPTACFDDGSCTYTYGCTDANAVNYNPSALFDDGSCCYVAGCTDANALNYNPNACHDDGSCCYVAGCIDASALNYNANACQDDGSCCYVSGCTDITAPNYNPNACFDDNSCLGIGDIYQGGVIFYLDGSGGGLMVPWGSGSSSCIYYQSIGWGCYGTDITGANGTANGTGAQNTIDIEAECSTCNPAVFCANGNWGGNNDWFLGSKDELILYYNSGLPFQPIWNGNYGLGYEVNLWSSSEVDSVSAWAYDQIVGQVVIKDKNSIGTSFFDNYAPFPIRAF